MRIHVLLRIQAFATTKTQRHCSAAPSPAHTPSLGTKTHRTPARGDQPPSAFVTPLKRRFFVPSVHNSPPERPVCDGSALWQPVHQHVCRQGAAGLRGTTFWLGGHHSPEGACLGEQGPLLPPLALFINSWLMSPSPHERKLSRVIVKMRARVNHGESNGEMFELGVFSLAKWRGECCCSGRTIKNTKYRLSGASDVVLPRETWFLIFK